MKLSDKTLKLLENFSDINPGVLLEEGSDVYTVAPNKTIFAKATIDEEFDSEAGIYNLKNFLRILNLFKEPDIELQENQFKISDGKQSVRYTYASKNMIFVPQKKNIKMPSVDVELELQWEDITKALDAAGILGMEKIALTGDGNNVKLEVYDPNNPTTDKYSVVLECEDVPEEEFTVLIKTGNLKLLPENYQVKISIDRLVKFETDNVEYYIVIEKE